MIFEEYTRKVFDDTGKTEDFLFGIAKYDCILCKHRNIDISNRAFHCKIMSITHENIDEAVNCSMFEDTRKTKY